MSARTATILSVSALAVSVVALVVALMALTAERPAAPTKDEPGAYTKSFVEEAISHYEREGLEATVAYYNDPAHIDGEWYVFIINEDGYNISHYLPEQRYADPSARVDSTGRFYGDEILGTTEEGRWVDYFFRNPETGEDDQKHAWVVKHDGLVFGSGWYER